MHLNLLALDSNMWLGSKYFSYNELKEKQTSPKDRPCYKPPMDPSPVAKELVKDNAKMNSGIFQTRNVHQYVTCDDCGKRRCIFSVSTFGFGANYFSHMRALHDVITGDA